MQYKNTKNHFGLVSISLHWVLAIFIISMLAVGIYMARLPLSPWKLKLIRLHKEFGLTVLALVVIRLTWRLKGITPLLEFLPAWESIIARVVQWIFYFFMLAMPISGWLMSSAAAIPVSYFGLFLMPDVIQANPVWGADLRAIHEWLGYSLIFFICLHTAAAFKHHFIDKDDVLRRMLWP